MPFFEWINLYRFYYWRFTLISSDLAKPILEELTELIEKFNLGRWESPEWIADIFDALYQCLVVETASEDDLKRAKALFEQICLTDPRKAISKKI